MSRLLVFGTFAAIIIGSSSLATEERVLIFSWSVWTWPWRLVRAHKYHKYHARHCRT